MTAMSTSFRARSSDSACRLPTSRRRSTPGCSRMKPAKSRGMKYFAVDCTPTVTRPVLTPFSRSIVSSASLRFASNRRA